MKGDSAELVTEADSRLLGVSLALRVQRYRKRNLPVHPYKEGYVRKKGKKGRW